LTGRKFRAEGILAITKGGAPCCSRASDTSRAYQGSGLSGNLMAVLADGRRDFWKISTFIHFRKAKRQRGADGCCNLLLLPAPLACIAIRGVRSPSAPVGKKPTSRRMRLANLAFPARLSRAARPDHRPGGLGEEASSIMQSSATPFANW